MPAPHINLGIGSGTHAEQTGNVLIAYEKVLMQEKPDLVVVVGDVNSTVAAALAAVKAGIRVAHLEAGLRSYDKTMPEEINRIVTDSISDYLWTTSKDANKNLEREGIDSSRIKLVGNIMIDSLVMAQKNIEQLDTYSKYGCKKNGYGLITLHRPSNVDDKDVLEKICFHLSNIADRIQLIFPVHPRTSNNLKKFGINSLEKSKNISLTDPLGYNDFMNLVFNSRFILTDSGGIQEETTYLQIPCLTLRPNTERPVTVDQGSNQLCKPKEIEVMVDSILCNHISKGSIPKYWDGMTAERIKNFIKDRFCLKKITL